MLKNNVIVGIASWVFQDGNYDRFFVGAEIPFALEFYAPFGFRKVEQSMQVGHTYCSGATYKIIGRIVYLEEDWWVIDFGIRAYRQDSAPLGFKVGDTVQAEVSIGVDPFPYSELLAYRPKSPALIADWKINRIRLQTAPFVRYGDVLVRDKSLIDWRDVVSTNARIDDDGRAEYILDCEMTSKEMRRSI